MDESSVFNSRSRSLEKMMDSGMGEGLWGADELGAILEHQLSAPLESDLRIIDREVGTRLTVSGVSGASPLTSFRDLFHHSHRLWNCWNCPSSSPNAVATSGQPLPMKSPRFSICYRS